MAACPACGTEAVGAVITRAGRGLLAIEMVSSNGRNGSAARTARPSVRVATAGEHVGIVTYVVSTLLRYELMRRYAEEQERYVPRDGGERASVDAHREVHGHCSD